MAERVYMIALSPTMEEGTILKWKKKAGDPVKMDEPLCDVETDKAAMEYLSTQEGTLLHIERGEGSSAKVGDVIAVIGAPGEDFASLLGPAKPESAASQPAAVQSAPAGKSAAPGPAPAADPTSRGRVKSSPLARKLAKDKGLDLGAVPGSGPGGRVVKADVLAFVPGTGSAAPAVSASGSSSAVLPTGADTLVPVSRKKNVVAKRLGESKNASPHFYLTVSAVMDGLLDARDRINAKAKEKLGLNAFLIKLTAEALKRHPYLNASWEGENIRLFGQQDVALAVAQSDGLITPIVRSSGHKGIAQIDGELKGLIDRARQGTLKPEEFTGATFTISNLGSFGIEEFTAIINPPGAAILALGAVKPTPVVDETGAIVVKRVMKATLSCDHRVIDGAVGAAFLADLVKMIEDPYTVLL